jgi:protocatechuate 3,4-dioxygenase beta subunit
MRRTHEERSAIEGRASARRSIRQRAAIIALATIATASLIGVIAALPDLSAKSTPRARITERAAPSAREPVRSSMLFERVAERPLGSVAQRAMQKAAALPLAPHAGDQITGRVVDAMGGPVAGAEVTALSERGAEELDSTESSDDGRFALSVARGAVRLLASAPSYSRALVQAAAPAAGVVLVLAPASSLAGRVVARGSGVGIAGARVTLSDAERTYLSTRTATTSDDGQFRFDELATGRYRLTAVHERWRSDERWAEVGLGETNDTLLLEALPAAALRGVLRVGEAPCAQGEVLLEGPTRAFAVASADGALEILGLASGRYAATLRCPDAIVQREALEIASDAVERTWQLDRGLTLAGSAQSAGGEALAGARVIVSPVLDEAKPEAERGVIAHTCRSDERGEFACSGLTPGEYECKLAGTTRGPSSVQLVSVAPGSAARVILRAPPEGSIRVTLAPGGATPTGLVVVARRAGERAAIAASRDGEAFAFDGLTLGEYEVYVAGSPASLERAHVERAGELVELTLAAPAARAIAGRVLDDGGEGVVDAWVRALPDPEHVGGLFAATEQVLTDDTGAFTIQSVSPGRYRLEASSVSGQAALAGVQAGTTDVQLQVASHAVAAP